MPSLLVAYLVFEAIVLIGMMLAIRRIDGPPAPGLDRFAPRHQGIGGRV